MENGYNNGFNNEFNTSNYNPPKNKKNRTVIGIIVVVVAVVGIAVGLLWKTDFFKSSDPDTKINENNSNNQGGNGESNNGSQGNNGGTTTPGNNGGNSDNNGSSGGNSGSSGNQGNNGNSGTTTKPSVPIKSKLTCKKEYTIENLKMIDNLVAEFNTNTGYIKTWNIEYAIDYAEATENYEGMDQETIIEEIRRIKESQLGDFGAFTVDTKNEGTLINFTLSTDESKLRGSSFYTDGFTSEGELYFPNYQEIYNSGEYVCE